MQSFPIALCVWDGMQLSGVSFPLCVPLPVERIALLVQSSSLPSVDGGYHPLCGIFTVVDFLEKQDSPSVCNSKLRSKEESDVVWLPVDDGRFCEKSYHTQREENTCGEMYNLMSTQQT